MLNQLIEIVTLLHAFMIGYHIDTRTIDATLIINNHVVLMDTRIEFNKRFVLHTNTTIQYDFNTQTRIEFIVQF